MKLRHALVVVPAVLVSACGGGVLTNNNPDAGTPAPKVDPFASYGAPLPSPVGEWTYSEVDGAKCGNGSPIGVLINRSSTSKRLVIYLEGGGACWDPLTCGNGFAEYVHTGIPQGDLDAFAGGLGTQGIFSRSDDDNPFKDASFAYIPYCTGDLHSGQNASAPDGVQHVGAINVEADLLRILPTFKDVSDVVLTGTSAGGYGALLNFDRVKQHVDETTGVPVRLLVDSAPPLDDDAIKPALQAAQRTAWNLDALVPTACGTSCTTLSSTFTFLVHAHPDTNIGFITSTKDQTLRQFFGLGLTPLQVMPAQQYADAVARFTTSIAADAHVRAFVIDSTQHVWIYNNPLGSVTSGSTILTDWVRGLLGESATWETVTP